MLASVSVLGGVMREVVSFVGVWGDVGGGSGDDLRGVVVSPEGGVRGK